VINPSEKGSMSEGGRREGGRQGGREGGGREEGRRGREETRPTKIKFPKIFSIV
jgi:hypothetical protein